MATSQFERKTGIPRLETKRKTSDGISVIVDAVITPLGLPDTADNKKTYPGAFSLKQITTISLDEITGKISDTILNTSWFRDTNSETT
jgi:hypothetical protein